MDARSPLFPPASLALSAGRDEADYLIPQLPEQPLFLTSSLQVYVVPAEKHLFVQGFKPSEYEGLPPTLLRGSLVVRVLRPSKIKAISLTFRGVQKTDWPEGIPPKKTLYEEHNDLVNHLWPFYQVETHAPNCGADMVAPRGSLDEHGEALPHTGPMAAIETTSLFAASLIKRATSPLGVPASPALLAPVDSFHDLNAVLSSLSLSTMDSLKPGAFAPGDYVYNFEHPLPALTPESVLVSFGSVAYYLEATVTRAAKFKAALTGRVPIDVVRVPADSSVEENEPIVIERDWEDQLRYEIVVASKSVVLDLYLPLMFRFIPLYGKVHLHRIRVYFTENCNYYCRNKAVHRAEPTRKFLLLEHKAQKNCSLLLENGGSAEDTSGEVLPRELEFQMFVPSLVSKKYDYRMHPDTAIDDIQCAHWIKISLRISKPDPNNAEKRKHFEILIDSPIHLCSPLAAHNNTLLPAYDREPEFLPRYAVSPPNSPGVTLINQSAQGGHLILSALGGFSANPGRPEILRSPTPVEFQHLSSLQNNDTAIRRDQSVHLESNLYQPEDATLDVLSSPQATAFTPVGSPAITPVTTRTQPSLEPPSFEVASIAQDTLPPAYEREAPLRSLSPLRLDYSPSRTPRGGSSPSGIKDLLGKQLDRRGRNGSDKESLNSDASSKKKQSLESVNKANVPTDAGQATLTPSSGHNMTNTADAKSAAEDETDIADFLSVNRPSSRKSSFSLLASLASNDIPIEQTLPLLSLTTTDEQRFLIDSARSNALAGSVTDLLETTDVSDGYHVHGSLFPFRNPRIKKHYQDEEQEEPIQRVAYNSNKLRQKSFGVLPMPDHTRKSSALTGSSAESNMTINECPTLPKERLPSPCDPLALAGVVSR